MSEITFETTIEREDESIDVEVTYEIMPYRPAIRYGDHPQPAEGGEPEILSITVAGEENPPEFELTDKEMESLINEIHNRYQDDIADQESDYGDYIRDLREEDPMYA